MNVATNPLLAAAGLPRFDLIQPEHVRPAMETLLTQARALVHSLTEDAESAQSNEPPTWENFAQPLSDGLEPLSYAWGIVGHLHSVCDVPAWRNAYNDLLPEVTRFFTELGQNLALFERYKALRAGAAFAHLDPIRQRIIDKEIRDFRLSGAELAPQDKPRYQAISEELAALAAKFQENVLDATNAFQENVREETNVDGLPSDVIEAARQRAEQQGEPGWTFNLHAPSYLPVMQYANHRSLRARLYRASTTRAAEFEDSGSKPEWNNLPIIDRLLTLKQEEARLLGYPDYAHVSLVPKMADTPAQVLAFLRDLAAKARPFAERDRQELFDFARSELGLEDIQPWDLTWASEKLKQARYAFSDQEVRQYFPEPKVLNGLFSVIERLFGLKVAEDQAPVWHPDVRFYRIEDPQGQLVGQFYLDLYARDTKRGGAWMDEALTRRRTAHGIQTPVAYLNCNFSAPVGDQAALFTHDEVTTLFHEMGHGLHHLLTQIEEAAVSGIHGVEWDAVELPSQFLENYAWEWSVLQDMTGHVENGAPLPRDLFDKMLAARNFQSGLMTLRQIEFALFDMRLHAGHDLETSSVLDLLQEVRHEIAVLQPPSWNRFPASFSHIFGGGYAAGYYSYKWAEVLSADAFAAFEEAGSAFDPVTGRRFLEEVLARGGSRPAMENFVAFRGRTPQVDALLRHSGMK